MNVTPSTPGWDYEEFPSRVGSEPVDDVVYAGRHPGLGTDLRQQRRGRWRLLARLDDNGVTACQRRRDLPGEQQEREIPRHDHRDDAERLADRVVQGPSTVRQLGQERGQARRRDGVGKHPEVGEGPGDVQLTGLLLRFAGIGGLGDDELLEPVLDPIRNPSQQGGALRHRGASPGAVQRSASGVHRAVDQPSVGLVHRGAGLAVHGIDLRPRRPVDRRGELTGYEVSYRAHISASPRAAHMRLSNAPGSPPIRRAYAARVGQVPIIRFPMILDLWSNRPDKSKIIDLELAAPTHARTRWRNGSTDSATAGRGLGRPSGLPGDRMDDHARAADCRPD